MLREKGYKVCLWSVIALIQNDDIKNILICIITIEMKKQIAEN